MTESDNLDIQRVLLRIYDAEKIIRGCATTLSGIEGCDSAAINVDNARKLLNNAYAMLVSLEQGGR